MGQVTRLVTATMIVIAASWTAVGGRQQSAQAVPEELRERLQEATRLYNRAQLSEAIQVLTSMVESPPPTEPAALDLHLQALFLRGRCQLLRNNPELAREDFSRLVTLNPGYEPSASVPKAVLGFFAEVKAGMTARFVLRVSPHDALVELDGAPVRLVAEREGKTPPRNSTERPTIPLPHSWSCRVPMRCGRCDGDIASTRRTLRSRPARQSSGPSSWSAPPPWSR